MKINWRARFRNKVWVASFLSCILTFAYTICSLFDICPPVTQDTAVKIVNAFLLMLSLMGVLTDPTTEGFGDSIRALSYVEPWADPHLDLTDDQGDPADSNG